MGSVVNVARPEKDGLLHSELAVAVCMIKTQLRHKPQYKGHRVYPVLLLSFHNIFSARVIQAHVDNGRLVVRSPRLLKLHSATLPTDAKLAIRWLNPIPRCSQGTVDEWAGDGLAEAPEAGPPSPRTSLPQCVRVVMGLTMNAILAPWYCLGNIRAYLPRSYRCDIPRRRCDVLACCWFTDKAGVIGTLISSLFFQPVPRESVVGVQSP